MPRATQKTETKKSATAATTRSSKKEATAPVKAEPVAEVQNEVVEEHNPIAQLEQSFAGLYQMINTISAQINSIKTSTRALEKLTVRELRNATKASAKRKRRAGNRAPSGFVKPAMISNELAAFLKRPAGTLMARTDVTREINGYIRDHKLQDSNNGRIINPDSSLSKLLKLKKGDELTYFNLQRYMRPHFQSVKDTAEATA